MKHKMKFLVSIVLAVSVVMAFSAISSAVVKEYTTKLDVKILPGSMELDTESAPKIAVDIPVDVDKNFPQLKPYVSGNNSLIIYDARETGAPWSLKMGISQFAAKADKNYKIDGISVKVNAELGSKSTPGGQFTGYPIWIDATGEDFKTIGVFAPGSEVGVCEILLKDIVVESRGNPARHDYLDFVATMDWIFEDAP